MGLSRYLCLKNKKLKLLNEKIINTDFSVQQVDEPNNEYKYARISSGGYKFPRQTAFIIFNEFCERFAYYGIRS